MRLLRPLALALVLVPLFSGCGDDGKKPADAGPPVVAPEITAGPIEEIAPPPELIGWGAVADVEKLADGVQTFAKNLTPVVPGVLDALTDELRRRLAMTKLEGIDWKRPARVAVFDPKGMPKGTIALVLPVSNKDQLLAGVPAAVVRKQNEEGNQWSYRDDMGRTVCLNFVDDTVVITWEKKQFAAHTQLFARLARATTREPEVFHLSVKNVAALYAKEIDEGVAQVKQQVAASQAQMPGVQAEVSLRVLSWMIETWKDLDRIEIVPRLADDGARVSLRLHPKADSALQKSFKAIEARPHTLLGRLPADATMFASFSTSPDAADGLTGKLIEWAMSVGFGGKVPEGYAQAMKEYFQSTTGEVAMAVHKPFGAEGLTLTTLLGVRDEEKLRVAMRKSKEALKDKAMVETFKKTGVTLVYREAAYKLGAVPVDTVETTFDKNLSPLARLGPFGEAIGDLSTTHTAVSSDLAIIAYGKDARRTIEGFVGKKAEGGLDKAAGPARALRLAVQNPVGIFYASPVEMAKRASLGGRNPFAESFKDLAATTGAAVSFSASGGALEIVVDVPGEQARTMAQGAARAKALFPQQ